MDPWLSPFSESEAEELLLVKEGKGAGAALLVKVIEGAPHSCPAASALICSGPMLPCVTLISAY